jgi:hypothetical protein
MRRPRANVQSKKVTLSNLVDFGGITSRSRKPLVGFLFFKILRTACKKEIGWTKGLELAKVARKDGQKFNCATWLHKAKEMPKEVFRREVERELTGEDKEPWEIVYFKLYKSQIPVIDRGLETAALMLGSDKSRS